MTSATVPGQYPMNGAILDHLSFCWTLPLRAGSNVALIMVLYSANIVGAWLLIALHLFVQNLPKKLGSIDRKRKNSKNKMKAN
jgi:hypothetical protein